jgi:hypothetical protein
MLALGLGRRKRGVSLGQTCFSTAILAYPRWSGTRVCDECSASWPPEHHLRDRGRVWAACQFERSVAAGGEEAHFTIASPRERKDAAFDEGPDEGGRISRAPHVPIEEYPLQRTSVSESRAAGGAFVQLKLLGEEMMEHDTPEYWRKRACEECEMANMMSLRHSRDLLLKIAEN